MDRVGVGILTYNRPGEFRRVVDAATQKLHTVVSRFYIHNDGSDEKHRSAYESIYGDLHGDCGIIHDNTNVGTAKAKNRLLKRMLHNKCDWLFLLEDDVIIKDVKAVTGYIEAAKEADVHHLTFLSDHEHRGAPAVNGSITLWQWCVAGWTLHSRQCLQDCGLFDEAFGNCLYDVEHTLRLGLHGYTDANRRRFPDATGSEQWLESLPCESVLGRGTFKYGAEYVIGKMHWHEAYPQTYSMIDW